MSLIFVILLGEFCPEEIYLSQLCMGYGLLLTEHDIELRYAAYRRIPTFVATISAQSAS